MKPRCITLTILALFVAAIAMAQPRPPQKALAEYLELSDEQIAAWQEIQKETAETVKPLAENAKDLREQLGTALKSASLDPVAVGKLSISLHSVREQIRAAHESAKAKRIALLSPEQKTKFEAFEAAAAFLRHERRGPDAMRPPASPRR